MPEKQAGTKFFFNKQYFDCKKSTYYPSEDSYFLAENTPNLKNKTAVDMGCGAGIQSLNLLFNSGCSKVTAIDINEEALKITKSNCEKAGFEDKIETIKSDLFENFNGTCDVIVFNPPYVPSDEKKYIVVSVTSPSIKL